MTPIMKDEAKNQYLRRNLNFHQVDIRLMLITVSKTYILILLCFAFTINLYGQNKYVQKQNGEILEYSVFQQEKNAEIARFKQKLGPDKHFDIIYDFEDPIASNDSIIIKVKGMVYSMAPPQMNRNNVFDEKKLIGKVIPLKTLQTLDNKTITLEDLKGKPTVLNFWHVACGPCIKEMPTLNQIHDELGDQVNFIAVTFEPKEKVQKFLSKRVYNFTHVINAADFMNDIQIQTFPKTIYLDKNGVVQKTEGVVAMNQKKKIKKYLNSLQ